MRHFLLMVLLCLAISSVGQTGEKVYFIRAAKLYDPVTNKFLANQDIIVRGRKTLPHLLFPLALESGP